MTKELTKEAKQAIDQHLKRDLAKIDAGRRFYVSDLDTNADLVIADYVDDYLINDPDAKNFIHSDNLRFSRQIDDIKTDVVTNDVSSYIYQKLLENPQICWNIREKDQEFGFECAHDTTALSLLSKEQMEDYKVVFDLLKVLQKATKNKNFSFDLAEFDDYPSDTSILLDDQHNPTSPAITYPVNDEPTNPAITYHVGDETTTNDPVNSWRVHNANVAKQNAAHHFGSNKAVNSVKRTDKHIIENNEVTKTSKISKTAKLNSNKVNAKTSKLVQPKLEQVQESTNRANGNELKHDALPQTGEKHSNLMAMLGLAISGLGLIGAMKLKKRKDD